jgi:hypothetical protein
MVGIWPGYLAAASNKFTLFSAEELRSAARIGAHLEVFLSGKHL